MALSPKAQKRIGLNKKAVEKLTKVLPKLKTAEESRQFLQDLMSSSEILDLARRLMATKLLFEGKTYQEIEDLLGMGPLTINKIHFKTRGSKILPTLIS